MADDVDRDEQLIRSLVQTWMEASRAGDLPRVLELMDDDVAFLGAGRAPMRGKGAFAAQTRAMEGKVRFEGKADVQEVRVFGDWAYSWIQLQVTVHPEDGSAPKSMAGPAMSILRRTAEGRWVIFRDANMVTPADRAPA
jgi:uncharacterized protein (TIGR02246 family)